MRETGLTALEFSEGDFHVKLERRGEAFAAAPVVGTVQLEEDSPKQNTAAENPEHFTVASPMVGVFYAAPGEDAKPYVTLGDTVKTGDTLCIIEAMKMMNEITAECDGVITEVCVSNKQVVEYGHPLFRIKTDK